MPDFKALVRERLGPLGVDPARAADIVDEIAQHCADDYAELRRSGLNDDEAIVQALAALDDPGAVARAISRADRPRRASAMPPAPGSHVWADVWREIRYAIRMMRRSPGFTVVAIVTLALGIGANTALFTVINAVLLRPLPYADPARLVMIGQTDAEGHAGNVGFATVADWRARTHAFDDIATIRAWYPTLVLNGEPERIPAMRVSANYFRTLGRAPAFGRDFADAEDTPAGRRLLIVSDGLWRRRLNADPSIVGRAVAMDDGSYTIVGIMPASFEPLLSEHFYEPAEMWAVLGYDRSQPFACRSCEHLKAIARLKPGVSVEAAKRDLAEVFTAMRSEHTDEYPATATAAITLLASELSRVVRPALLAMMGAVALVVLIACANVANLLLARLSGRHHDLALRAALGASRARIVRQLLIESGLLALAGGGAGLVCAAVLVPLMARLTPVPIPRLATAAVDLRVAAFAFITSAVSAIVFGLYPAVRASRFDLQSALHAHTHQTAVGPTSLARRALMAADVALAVVLLAGAGLMTKSVGRLLAVDPGFDAAGVLTMQLSLSGKAYETPEAVVARGDAIVSRLSGLPDVESVALADQIPLGGNIDRWGLHVEGRAPTPDDPSVERYAVTPEYFRTMRIPLRRGRLLTSADRANTERVVLIGERTARTVWPDADPLGQHIRIGGTTGPVYSVVGIVGDVRHVELAAPPTLQMYVAEAQTADSFLTVVMRTRGDLALLAPTARAAVASIAHDIPVYGVTPLASLVDRSVGSRRFVMVLLELFGALAIVMTAVGVYGVISYSVAARTREIGLRAALGASSSDIVWLVLGTGVKVVLVGIVFGVGIGAVSTRFLHDSLYAVSPTDPGTFGRVAVLLFIVAAAAHLVPVMRAIRVDPVVALRQE